MQPSSVGLKLSPLKQKRQKIELKFIVNVNSSSSNEFSG